MQVRISSQHDSSLEYLPFRRENVENGCVKKAFYTGGNSTCRVHIRRHYELYKTRCEEQNIPKNHHAIPRTLWNQMQELKANPKTKVQSKLDRILEKKKQTFSREGALHAVSQFVACNDQV